MLWIIFTIWVLFVITCVIMEKKTENQFFTFLFLISLPIMFYIPLFLKQNKK